MNKYRKMLYGACALLIANIAAPLNANAGEFNLFNLNDPFNVSGGGASGSNGGPYIAIQAGAHGAAMRGTGTGTSTVTDATIGEVFAGVGANIGWNIPVSDAFLIGIDINIQPGEGKITIDSGDDDVPTDTSDVTLTMKDSQSIFLVPMIATSDNSALYVKWGVTQIALGWTGDVVAGLNSSMLAETVAIGSRSLIGEHGFVQTEFGYNDFNTLNIHTTNSGIIGTANPESVKKKKN
jgi:hypothetical protein